MKSIIFVMRVASQVRFRKRIYALSQLGFKTTPLAFEQDYIPGKPEGGYISLGSIEKGNYLKRFMPFVRAFPVIRHQAKTADVLYCFGLDMLLLSWLVKLSLGKPVKLVYEIGDIRQILTQDKPVSKLLRHLETFLVKQTHLLVTTSEAFIESYYQGILKLKNFNYQIIENKLDQGFLASTRTASSNNAPTAQLGYFGLLRCTQTWKIMERLTEKGVSIYVRGYPHGELTKEMIEKATQTNPNLKYGGSYIAPDELTGIYNQVELVWAAYPYNIQQQTVGNHQWARTNRFYESCYFAKPVICQTDTEDGRIAEKLNIGIATDLSNVDEAVRQILMITPEQIRIWTENIKNLPKTVYTYSDEHEKLASSLES
jgi:succinoglycan biosynthesis protein ExoL